MARVSGVQNSGSASGNASGNALNEQRLALARALLLARAARRSLKEQKRSLAGGPTEALIGQATRLQAITAGLGDALTDLQRAAGVSDSRELPAALAGRGLTRGYGRLSGVVAACNRLHRGNGMLLRLRQRRVVTPITPKH